MTDALQRLGRRLGHAFSDPALLGAALRHRSAGAGHNERLEFLGDGLLNGIIAAALYRARPAADEGELSRWRALLVRGSTLAQIGRELGLPGVLELGAGERRGGGCHNDSILADAVEAVIGAVYLDADHAACEALVLRLFADRLRELPSSGALKDPKTRLQEWLQGRGRGLPRYAVIAERGAAHAREFDVSCALDDGGEPSCASGRSRRAAEQAAAEAMLRRLHAGAERSPR